MTTERDRDSSVVPQDPYSRRLRELRAHPEAVEKDSSVEDTDWYGNVVSYHVKTVSHDGQTTAFVERGSTEGGVRFVLPPKVMAALFRQKDSAVKVKRSRAARKAMATREASGFVPFVAKAK